MVLLGLTVFVSLFPSFLMRLLFNEIYFRQFQRTVKVHFLFFYFFFGFLSPHSKYPPTDWNRCFPSWLALSSGIPLCFTEFSTEVSTGAPAASDGPTAPLVRTTQHPRPGANKNRHPITNRTCCTEFFFWF